MKTIVMFTGSSGSGKTTLSRTIEQRARHLIAVPEIEHVFEGSVVSVFDQINPDVIHAIGANESVRPFVDEAIGDADCLLMEPWHYMERIIQECANAYNMIHIHVVAAPWMQAQRIYLRFQRRGMLYKYKNICRQLYSNNISLYLEFAKGVSTVFVDGSDWPVRVITEEEARSIIDNKGEPTKPVLMNIDQCYQKSLRINHKWYGVTAGDRFNFERNRLNQILPSDMKDMTMLDIGASEGGFCYEALNRGALYCQAVELRPEWCKFIQRMRNAAQLPISTAELDIATYDLPLLQNDGTPMRHSFATMLNVLHHIRPSEQTEKVLEKVLNACDRIVIEGPFCDGTEPRIANAAPYPNAMLIPDKWVAEVGARHSFTIDAIEPSNMQPPHRRLWKLSRKKKVT